mmetsp:Transcript_15027/g.27313  ORF Transcript_15027/g.27313 Transcript_15027/m.27313 type:complete len:107 (-) Transcript_15027:305-625(-)
MDKTSQVIESLRVHETRYNKIYAGTKNQKIDVLERKIFKSLLNFIVKRIINHQDILNKSSHANHPAGSREHIELNKQAIDDFKPEKQCSLLPDQLIGFFDAVEENA